MERLTNKKIGIVVKGTISEEVKERALIYEKLQQLENIEEELGIDLITLFMVLEQDYIYFKHYYAWDNKFKINKEYITGLKCIEDNTIALFTESYYGKEHIVYLKDYGKTWSLDRNELEND